MSVKKKKKIKCTKITHPSKKEIFKAVEVDSHTQVLKLPSAENEKEIGI